MHMQEDRRQNCNHNVDVVTVSHHIFLHIDGGLRSDLNFTVDLLQLPKI